MLNACPFGNKIGVNCNGRARGITPSMSFVAEKCLLDMLVKFTCVLLLVDIIGKATCLKMIFPSM